jgi:tetratricopeptide (TPR) repeat protein
MLPFMPQPNRDAYATIRGFAYQVDLTIDRWLSLRAGEVLELECGEDVDHIARALGTESFSLERLVEQIKHRENSVTLRTHEALEAIANAIRHRADNPNHDIILRFTTNTAIGHERAVEHIPAPPVPLLELWEKLRTGQDAGMEPSEGLTLIRTFITSLSKPEKFKAGAWAQLQTFFSGARDDELSELVSHVEWSTGTTDARHMQRHLERRLLELGHATDQAQAEQQYQRLFLHVFKLLCERGRKQLTPDGLRHQLSLPTLSEADHNLLLRVRDRLRLLEMRLGAVEGAVAVLEMSVAGLADRLDIHTQVAFLDPPWTDPPPLPDQRTPRNESVSGMVDALSATTWLALYGGEDTGKTTLARLVADAHGNLRAWIRLDTEAQSDAGYLAALERSLAALFPEPVGHDRRACDGRLMASLRPGSLLVLDDLPDLATAPRLAARLRTLADACRAHGVRMLSLGVHPVPAATSAALAPDAVHVMPAPLLTESEVGELLGAYGAPAALRQTGIARLLHTLTSGHPVLACSAALFLRDHEWNLREATLENLLRGDHASAVTEDVLRRLMDSVAVPARQLLYRLSLARSPFTIEEVDAVATVPPPIDRHREALAAVVGPWARRTGQQHFELSPLLMPVGKAALSPDIQAACHAAFGHAIIRRQSIGMTEVVRGIHHFLSAEQHDRAGVLFLMGLQAVRDAGDPAIGEPLISLWHHDRMPREMSAGVRLLARAYQLFIRAERGLQSETILADIRATFDEVPPEDAWAIAGAGVFVSIALAPIDVLASHDFLLRAVNALPGMRGPTGQPVEFQGGVTPELLLRGTIPHLRGEEEIEDWFRTLAAMPDPARVRLFSGTDGLLTCIVLPEHVARNSALQQQWGRALELLDEVAAHADRIGSEELHAAALRVQIRIHVETLKHIDDALRIAGRVDEFHSPAARYFILSEMGRQLAIAQRFAEARPWLERAINEEPDGFPSDPVYVRIAASVAFGEQDPEAAVRYAADAVRLARSSPLFPETEIAAVACAYALQVSRHAGPEAAVRPWQQAAELVFAAEDDTDAWRCVFIAFAHAITHTVRIARTGAPPERNHGGTVSTEPTVHRFFVCSADFAACYQPANRANAAYIVGQCLEHVGDPAADDWYARAESLADMDGNQQTAALCAASLAVREILAHRWTAALQTQRRARRILTASLPQHRGGHDEDGPAFDPEAVARDLSAENLQPIEEEIAMAVVVPATLHLLGLALHSPDETREHANQLAAACRDASADAPHPDFWERIATTIEAAFDTETTRNDLVRIASGEDMHLVVRFIARLAGAQADVAEIALQDHLPVLPALIQRIPPGTAAYHRVLLPYVQEFWEGRVSSQAFRLSGPAQVRAGLQAANERPEADRIRAILAAVRTGVSLGSVPDQVQTWLQGENG